MPTEEEAKKILNEILKMMAESTLKSSDLEELRIAQAKIKELQDKMYDSGVIEAYQNSVNGYFNKIFFLIHQYVLKIRRTGLFGLKINSVGILKLSL